MPHVSVGVLVDDVDLPEVLRRHGDVVVYVAGDLLVVRGHRGGNVVGVKGAVGHAVDQLDGVPVLDGVDGLGDRQLLPLRPLDDPPVVDVLEGVAGDLLLVGGAPTVGVPEHRHKLQSGLLYIPKSLS